MHQMSVVRKAGFVFAAVILTVTVVISLSAAEARRRVVILHAGSLKVPLAEMEKRFEKNIRRLFRAVYRPYRNLKCCLRT